MNKQNNNEAPMPSDTLPECWWDNDRMNALFAPFRNKNVNSEDWNSKLQFWTKFITDWGISNNICSFNIVDLKKAFKRDGRAPGCIQTVVEEMFKSGELQTMDRFMQTPQETWSGWAIDLLVKKPIYWSYTKMKETVVALTDDNTKFVNIKTVKSVSEKILNSINEDYVNKLINFHQLTTLVQSLNITEENLRISLHYLRCTGKISIKENETTDNTDEDKLLIKFAAKNEKAIPVNDFDISIYALERNEEKLIKMIEELEGKKDAVIADAKAYLAKGMKPLAKNCLRKKLTLEKCIEKRSNILDNVQMLLSQVKETEYQTKVVDSYKKGISAFKSTYKEAGLTEDNVNEVINDVQEVLEMHDEIQSSLGQNLSQTPGILKTNLFDNIKKMKFLICLIVFGVCGVFSEEAIPSSPPSTVTEAAASPSATTVTEAAASPSATTVTEAATSSSASSATEAATSSSASPTTEAATAAPVNPIPNIIDHLHEVAKNLQDAILNATKELGNAANNAVHNASESGVGSEVMNPLISTITQIVQGAINDISKRYYSGMNGLLNSTTQALSEASTKISNLQECANKNGQSPVNITEPLGKLLQCPVNAFAQVSEPVGKGVQLIKQIGDSITSEVTGAIKCFQTPIFGFIPNVGCFAGIGIQSLLLGITNASSGFGVASSFGDDIFTLIPNTMNCFNQQWVGIVQTFTKSGVNVAKCLQ